MAAAEGGGITPLPGAGLLLRSRFDFLGMFMFT